MDMPALHPTIRAGVARRGPKSARVTEKSDPAVEGFLALASARLAPRTVEAYRRDLAHLSGWLGAFPAVVRAAELTASVAQLRAAGLAPPTIAPTLSAGPPFFRLPDLRRVPVS